MARGYTRMDRLGWLVPPALLIGVGLGVWVTWHEPKAVLPLVLGLGLAFPTLWILISALWPGKADRRCRECGASELVRIDPATTLGLRCRACGFRDESASGWLLAEEEGPLEELVLNRRRNSRQRIRTGKKPASSDVDRRVRSN